MQQRGLLNAAWRHGNPDKPKSTAQKRAQAWRPCASWVRFLLFGFSESVWWKWRGKMMIASHYYRRSEGQTGAAPGVRRGAAGELVPHPTCTGRYKAGTGALTVPVGTR